MRRRDGDPAPEERRSRQGSGEGRKAMLLSLGVRHSAVRSIQEMLNHLGFGTRDAAGRFAPLVVDGVYGAATESAVVDFQRSEGILGDGIVGPNCMRALEKAYAERVLELNSPGVDALMGTPERLLGMPDRLVFERVPADRYNGQGYDRLSLRADVAEKYRQIYDAVRHQGGLMTSSGGIRSLQATQTRSRSATSFHYLGRALDLFIYSGMVDPAVDPYVVSREEERLFRVFARCSTAWNADAELPAKIEVPNVITYAERREGVSVTDHFIDLTALFEQHGFKRINARRRFVEGGSMMGAEWWHFQDESGLIEGQSTFGFELLKVYAKTTLEGTAPWNNRDRIFGVDWS